MATARKLTGQFIVAISFLHKYLNYCGYYDWFDTPYNSELGLIQLELYCLQNSLRQHGNGAE